MSWANILKQDRLSKLRELLNDSMKDKKFVDKYMKDLKLTEENIDEYLETQIDIYKTILEGETEEVIIQFIKNYLKQLEELKTPPKKYTRD